MTERKKQSRSTDHGEHAARPSAGPITGEVALASEEATASFGRGLASVLRAGDVVKLTGDLGAGKTTLVRAIASALGVPSGMVSSPTFVLINVYPFGPGDNWPRAGRLIHVDAYRAHGTETLANAGWDGLFDDSGVPRAESAAVIEWPERIAAALPPNAAEITLETTAVESRLARVSLPESWRSRPGADFLAWREPTPCRLTGIWVDPTNPNYPFASAKGRLADLGNWLGGNYRIGGKGEASSE